MLAQQVLHIARIMNTNAIPHSGPMRFAGAVYPTLVMLKHSCLPNVELSFDDASKTGVLRSVVDIQQGEELTVDWVDGAMEVWEERSRRLQMIGGRCFCDVCAIDHATPEDSSARTATTNNTATKTYHPYRNPLHSHTPSPAELTRLQMTLHHANLHHRLHTALHNPNTTVPPLIPESLAVRLLVSGTELASLQDSEPTVRTAHTAAHEALALAYLALGMPVEALGQLGRVERILGTVFGVNWWVGDVRSYIGRVRERMEELEGGGGGTRVEDERMRGFEDSPCRYEKLVQSGLLWFFERYDKDVFRVWEDVTESGKEPKVVSSAGGYAGEMSEEDVQDMLRALKREGRVVGAFL